MPSATSSVVLPAGFSVLACWPSRGPPRRVQSLGATLTPAPALARDLQPRPFLSPPHVLGRRLRGNQAAITMRAADKQGEDEQRACIMFEGREVCGPVRFEDDITCIFNGQRWVCA